MVLATGLLLSCTHQGGAGRGQQDVFSPVGAFVRLYQGPLNHLSAVKQSGCPMYPSCSRYSMECVEKHGSLIGWVMSCDRLMRCGRDELDSSPRVLVNGQWKCYDPVTHNDFWWTGAGEKPRQVVSSATENATK